jgi:hypothetical protein
MVGRERRGGRQRRAGRAVANHLSIRLQRSAKQLLSWWTQQGRGHLGCPPTPQAPQGRGAQRGSRDAERPEAFIRMFLVLTFCEEAFQNLVEQDQS